MLSGHARLLSLNALNEFLSKVFACALPSAQDVIPSIFSQMAPGIQISAQVPSP